MSVCTRWRSLEPDVALAALGVLPARGLDPKPCHPAKPLEPWAPSVVSRPHRRLARRASSNYCGEASSDDRRKSDPIPDEPPPFLEGPLDDCRPQVASPPRATAHAGVLRLAATQGCTCSGFQHSPLLTQQRPMTSTTSLAGHNLFGIVSIITDAGAVLGSQAFPDTQRASTLQHCRDFLCQYR